MWVAAGIDEWKDGAAMDTMQDIMADRLAGHDPRIVGRDSYDPYVHPGADALLLDMAEHVNTTRQSLYRGIALGGNKRDEYPNVSKEFPVGKTFDLGPQGFSHSQTTADHFSQGFSSRAVPSRYTPVIFKLESGAKSYPIDKRGKKVGVGGATSDLRGEREHISGGTMTVTGVRQIGRGEAEWEITLRQDNYLPFENISKRKFTIDRAWERIWFPNQREGISKHNPYHDSLGRFTNAAGAVSGAGITAPGGPGQRGGRHPSGHRKRTTKGDKTKSGAKDKRVGAKQQKTHFIDPRTGRKMKGGPGGVGDVFETVLANNPRVKAQFERELGAVSRRAGGGAVRTKGVDFVMGKFGVELKTSHVDAKEHKSGIRGDSLKNKQKDCKLIEKTPATIVQVVDQKNSRVDVYIREGKFSRERAGLPNGKGMPKRFTYELTPDDIAAAADASHIKKSDEGLLYKVVDGMLYVFDDGESIDIPYDWEVNEKVPEGFTSELRKDNPYHVPAGSPAGGQFDWSPARSLFQTLTGQDPRQLKLPYGPPTELLTPEERQEMYELTDEEFELLNDIIGFEDPKTGMRAEVIKAYKWGGGGGTEVDLAIRDSNGDMIGKISMNFERDGQVHWSHFEIYRPDAQGQGFAYSYLGANLYGMKMMGVQGIYFDANIDVGGYAWAKAGVHFENTYSGSLPRRMEMAGEGIRGVNFDTFQAAGRNGTANRYAEQHTATIDKYKGEFQEAYSHLEHSSGGGPITMITPGDVAQIGAHEAVNFEGYTMWPGKAVTLGSSYEAVIDLDSMSEDTLQGIASTLR